METLTDYHTDRELLLMLIDLVSRGTESKGPYVRNTLAIDKNATRGSWESPRR